MLSVKENQKYIIKTFAFSFIVLVICIVTCVLHVVDIKSNFEKETSSHLQKSLQASTQVISDQMSKSTNVLVEASELISQSSQEPTEKGIVDILNQSQKIDNFVNLIYIRRDGLILYYDGTRQNSSEEGMFQYVDVDEATTMIMNPYETANKIGLTYYIVPVYYQDTKIGELVGIKYLDGLLKEGSFQYLNQIGDLYLIDSTGTIQTVNSDQMVAKNYQSNNIYERLESIVGSSNSNRSKLVALKTNLSNEEYQFHVFQDAEGNRIDVAVMKIPSVKGMYLVHCFPDTVFVKMVQPIVFRTIVTCTIIILIMLLLLIYVWASGKRAGYTIEKLAYIDETTEGKNFNYFKEKALSYITENREVPYLIERFDVSNFRYINEAYGHIRADELLMIIYREGRHAFHDKEICVRMDSDQFVIAAKNDIYFSLRQEEFENGINEAAKEIGIKFPIRLKCGIYQVRQSDFDIQLMIDRANVARKSLMGEEKNLVAIYSDKIINDMRKIDKIESEMEAALANNEFKVFIQPKWDIEKNEVCGGEALVRWVKADNIAITPDKFVPIFEKNGFVEQLDFFMLEAVCKKMRELLDAKKKIFPISVNQSRFLLHNPEYVTNVEKILQRYNIPKGFIELELTETVFFSEREKMISIMNMLKKREVLISMDDFGSGYSSLNLLKDIPFDVLKIDREFFSESITSESSTWILRKIVEMAEGLGIKVLCEGVETEEQVDILRGIGCKYVQGYYYARPMAMHKFIEIYIS